MSRKAPHCLFSSRDLAGHELDRRLEATNGQFVRFADDIVADTNNHDDALKILKAFEDHCRYSGIKINHQKSPGISLLSSDIRSERRSFFVNDGDGDDIMLIDDFDYIGHKFSNNKIEISTSNKTDKKTDKQDYIYPFVIQLEVAWND